jgi:hypothetical protein
MLRSRTLVTLFCLFFIFLAGCDTGPDALVNAARPDCVSRGMGFLGVCYNGSEYRQVCVTENPTRVIQKVLK